MEEYKPNSHKYKMKQAEAAKENRESGQRFSKNEKEIRRE